MPEALFVVTNLDRVREFPNPTGFDIREAAAVWSALNEAGFGISFASRLGGTAKGVLKGEITASIGAFVDAVCDNLVVPTSTVKSQLGYHYDLIYFVGGLGCMWDFPYQDDMHQLIGHGLARGTRIAAICHGPAVFLGLTDAAGGGAFAANRHITGFSDAEEISRGVLDRLPFSLQQALTTAGAHYTAGADGQSHVVVDGPLITAQNPASLPELCATLTTQAAFFERTAR
jgi:putative intracellular protease/amidase